MDPKANIVLVGFMATGKTTTGQYLAKMLDRPFIDMDHEIERREGRAVRDIFAQSGEPYFRQKERELVRELAGRTGYVIAPGGGIVLNPDNIRDFEASGYVFCLRARPETVLSRVGDDTTRPLLQGGDKLQKIRDLLDKRKPLYAIIHRQMDTDGLTPEAVGDLILKELRPA